MLRPFLLNKIMPTSCTLTDNTPAQLLAILVGPTSLGRIGPEEMQADIDTNGDNSQREKAKADIVRLADDCALVIADIDTETNAGGAQCQNLNLALKWYTLYRYKALDIATRDRSECNEDDYRQRANMLRFTCEALRAIGSEGICMAEKLKAEISGDTCGELDGVYGSCLVTNEDC